MKNLFMALALLGSLQGGAQIASIDDEPGVGSSYHQNRWNTYSWDINVGSLAPGYYTVHLELSADAPLNSAGVYKNHSSAALVVATKGGGEKISSLFQHSGSSTWHLVLSGGELQNCKDATMTVDIFDYAGLHVITLTKDVHTMGQNDLVLSEPDGPSNGDLLVSASDYNAFESITLNPGFESWSGITTRMDIVSGCSSMKTEDMNPSIFNEEAEKLHLYPNPVSESLNLSQIMEGAEEISIMNTLGQPVYNARVNGPSMSIDFSGQPRGIYIVTVKSATGSQVQKFVKQ